MVFLFAKESAHYQRFYFCLLLSVLFALYAYPALAAQKGGGFSCPGPALSTVADVLKMRDNTYASLRGKLEPHVGGRPLHIPRRYRERHSGYRSGQMGGPEYLAPGYRDHSCRGGQRLEQHRTGSEADCQGMTRAAARARPLLLSESHVGAPAPPLTVLPNEKF